MQKSSIQFNFIIKIRKITNIKNYFFIFQNKDNIKPLGHEASYVPSRHWGKYEVRNPHNDEILLVTYTADHQGFQPVIR